MKIREAATLASLFRRTRADIRRACFKLLHASAPDRETRLAELATIAAARRRSRKNTARLVDEAKQITTRNLRWQI